ncbi:hypothetical protein HPB48_002501 [Haemaphysalis longicornis]|uniref:Phosphoribosyltransferase domain-containing protein n=1 Tax=Haemaphysalis longicornis TaxID=44386 RepID=A0A9J6G7R1_HAELO|nr:hypothetical protein HPB48_002501 [Haemaphysalis longicornis]
MTSNLFLSRADLFKIAPIIGAAGDRTVGYNVPDLSCRDRAYGQGHSGTLQWQTLPGTVRAQGRYRFFADMLDKMRQHYHFNPNSTPFSTDFIRVKSYVGDKSSGEVTVMGLDCMQALKGQRILIVEDIIDTGKTMAALLEYLKGFQTEEIKVASLFVKRNPASSNYKPDYCGFELPDKFVVGYALDYNDHFRDLSQLNSRSQLCGKMLVAARGKIGPVGSESYMNGTKDYTKNR